MGAFQETEIACPGLAAPGLATSVCWVVVELVKLEFAVVVVVVPWVGSVLGDDGATPSFTVKGLLAAPCVNVLFRKYRNW